MAEEEASETVHGGMEASATEEEEGAHQQAATQSQPAAEVPPEAPTEASLPPAEPPKKKSLADDGGSNKEPAAPTGVEGGEASHIVVATAEPTPFATGQKPAAVTKSFLLRNPDMTELLANIQALDADDLVVFFERLVSMGLDPPLDEGGNKTVTYSFLEEASVPLVNSAYQAALLRVKEQPKRPSKEEKRPSLEGERKASKDDGDKSPRKSVDSGANVSDFDINEELYLSERQKELFYEKIMALQQGIHVPRNSQGQLKFTKGLIDTLPQDLANEILDTVDINFEGSDYSTSSGESDFRRGSRRSTMRQSVDPILGLRRSKGINYITNDFGVKLTLQEVMNFLKKAYSDGEIQRENEVSKERDATLRAIIREEHRQEEKDANLKRADSMLKITEMAMRYIPEYNMMPIDSDPIDLLEKLPKREITGHGPGNVVKIADGKANDIVHLLAPKEFDIRQMDSFATFTSTIDKKISLATMRGSLLSTHLSDMPSMYSQALIDELSEATLTPSAQEFDITDESIARFMASWLVDFMRGFVPKNTFVLKVVNMINRREVELRVCKHYTMNEVCHLYMAYEDHPEYYVWKDIYGRVLNPVKTLVENGLVRQEEVLEFQGYRRLPVILLYFRDGFESEPPLPLNPLLALRRDEKGYCRNY